MKWVMTLAVGLAALAARCFAAESGVKVLDQVVLLDVQGLWGGRDLWVASDGRAVCRFVERPKPGESGRRESRSAFSLTREQRETLLRLVNEHRFMSLRTADRPGSPDESRPVIFVKSGARQRAVGKWANDKHKDFDPLYEFLKQVAESGKKGRPERADGGAPEGFPDEAAIRALAGPRR